MEKSHADSLLRLNIVLKILVTATVALFFVLSIQPAHAAVTVAGSGATAGGATAVASLSGLPANTIVIVGASCYGDGNYGLVTPTDWTRTTYTQPGGGAGAVYYRYFTSAPAVFG